MNNKKVVHDIKDNSYKKVFDEPELFCQFIKDFINIDLLKNITPSDISDYTERFLPLFIDHKDSDTIKVIKIKEDVFVITMIEHQSKSDYIMSFRMLLYMSLIWELWIKECEEKEKGSTEKKDFKLPPILPIVYYSGDNKWTADLNFKNKVYLNDVFEKYTPKFEYELVELNKYPVKDLLMFQDMITLMMIIDKIKKPDEIKIILDLISTEYIEKIKEKMPDNLLKSLEEIIYLFLKRINVPDVEIKEISHMIYERRFLDMFELLEDYDVQKVRKEIREEIREEVKAEVKAEIEEKVRAEVVKKVKEEVRAEVVKKVKEEVRAEVVKKVEETVKAEVVKKVKEEVKAEVKEEVKAETEHKKTIAIAIEMIKDGESKEKILKWTQLTDEQYEQIKNYL